MFKLLKSLFPARLSGPPQLAADPSGLAPDRLLLVMGDIHGSFDIMRQTIKRVESYVEADAARLELNPTLVFVGDYIDRGENSADVLSCLFELQCEIPDRVICLMGNHERMLLDFLDDPVGRGHRWLRNGGLQTLASYQIGGVHERSEMEVLMAASEELERVMPDGMIPWLRHLPLSYRSGNVCVVHAAMDPHLDPDDQPVRGLLWGHRDFLTTPRTDGLWVVHGHTVVPAPCLTPSRISVDTGAYHSGRLSVAAISSGQCTFI